MVVFKPGVLFVETMSIKKNNRMQIMRSAIVGSLSDMEICRSQTAYWLQQTVNVGRVDLEHQTIAQLDSSYPYNINQMSLEEG